MLLYERNHVRVYIHTYIVVRIDEVDKKDPQDYLQCMWEHKQAQVQMHLYMQQYEHDIEPWF
jgi:hypothetical protein